MENGAALIGFSLALGKDADPAGRSARFVSNELTKKRFMLLSHHSMLLTRKKFYGNDTARKYSFGSIPVF
jgi:hypothetical protein